MIRHSTARHFNGKRVSPGDVVQGTDKQREALLACGQAYIDESYVVPDMNNTKDEIISFLDAHNVDYLKSMTKSELLECLQQD